MSSGFGSWFREYFGRSRSLFSKSMKRAAAATAEKVVEPKKVSLVIELIYKSRNATAPNPTKRRSEQEVLCGMCEISLGTKDDWFLDLGGAVIFH